MNRIIPYKALPLCLLKNFNVRHQNVPIRRPLAIHDNFLTGASSAYIENMYFSWLKDPNSVDCTWREVFENSHKKDFDTPLLNEEYRPASETPHTTPYIQNFDECLRLTRLFQGFEKHAHLFANLNPIPIEFPTDRDPRFNYAKNIVIDLERFGFKQEDYNHLVHIGFLSNFGGILSLNSKPMTVMELYKDLREKFCGKIAYEYAFTDSNYISHMRDSIYSDSSFLNSKFKNEELVSFLNILCKAVMFEDLISRKFGLVKRFGLDGAESFILGMMTMIEQSAKYGVDKICCGMAHRGRLNSLVNIFGKPLEILLKEFKGLGFQDLKPYDIVYDVKYHLGSSGTHKFGEKAIEVELLFNPSHLESVNPLVQGRAKSAQVDRGDPSGSTVIPVEIHGDAAFSGQGIAYETMAISEVGKYSTFGTIHVVINNQIGFTTDPIHSRSSAHCTDLGRVFRCPIVHVNGDSPEDVVRVFKFAAEFRAKFKKSIVIDLVCYRRFGHNESDVPSLTQPLLYDVIGKHPDIFTLFSEQLISRGVVTKAQCEEIKSRVRNSYNETFNQVDGKEIVYSKYIESTIPKKWDKMAYSDSKPQLEPTGASKPSLNSVITALNTTPKGFAVHPTLRKIFERRHQCLVEGKGIDWGTAEALAFGTLLIEGYSVHLSGEDVERATFSQRHAVLHDQETNALYVPLEHIPGKTAQLTISNSPLSEYGALGFAVGYSLNSPNTLCIWEAQFGDFANGAQIIFDQFLSSAESKWNQMNSVVVSMPHGYDGMGPEHSSGRIERFLQFVSEKEDVGAMSVEERLHKNNIEITYLSTPAQYFHLLRRQVKRNFRKPLINFFSKAYLREVPGTLNTSSIDEFIIGVSEFKEVIEDNLVSPDQAKRVVFVSGQLYHKLYADRAKKGIKDVALVRIEQLAPFPLTEVKRVLERYPTQELYWAQEEPQNMGAWWYLDVRFENLLMTLSSNRTINYAGREPSPSPATGYKYAHEHEEEQIIRCALDIV